MEEILDLLKQNARLSTQDIAAMTKRTTEEVAAIIAKLEADGVILKYTAIVNPAKEYSIFLLPCECVLLHSIQMFL